MYSSRRYKLSADALERNSGKEILVYTDDNVLFSKKIERGRPRDRKGKSNNTPPCPASIKYIITVCVQVKYSSYRRPHCPSSTSSSAARDTRSICSLLVKPSVLLVVITYGHPYILCTEGKRKYLLIDALGFSSGICQHNRVFFVQNAVG